MTQEQAIYARRFATNERYREYVWKALVHHVFQRYIRTDARVLDLGCGYGEFINNVRAARRYAMDTNPDAHMMLAPGIEFIEQNSSLAWPVDDGSLDVIFSSNFFEHLATKEALRLTLAHAWRALCVGGTLIAMGPNIRFLAGTYWDFIDHNIALSDRSMVEAMELAGFSPNRAVDRFLPYTVSGAASSLPLFLVDLYLRMPLVWRFFGKQFLIIMEKQQRRGRQYDGGT
jgi:SAM-dependent methyltransferase